MFLLGPPEQGPPRTKRRQKLRKEGPPAAEPCSAWDVEGFLIGVQVTNGIDTTASFLRFKIPTSTLNYLMDLSTADDSSHENTYVYHSHDSDCDRSRFNHYTLNRDLNGPFSSELSCHGYTAALGSVVYGVDGSDCKQSLPPTDSDYNPHCHSIRYCDFSNWKPRWVIIPPITRHPISPVMVPVNNQLYFFEREGQVEDEDEDDSLGFLFDPSNKTCKDVPFCAFHSVGYFNLMVASLGCKLLLLDHRTETQYCYDVERSTWTPLYINGLLDHILDFRTQPISVPEHKTIYWIGDKGDIRAFDWVNSKLFLGAVVGFGHEYKFREAYKYSPKLVHLKADLFCLVWSNGDDLHLTVIRVCLCNTMDLLSQPPYRLAASVVACSCYHMENDSAFYSIVAAYLLDVQGQETELGGGSWGIQSTIW